MKKRKAKNLVRLPLGAPPTPAPVYRAVSLQKSAPTLAGLSRRKLSSAFEVSCQSLLRLRHVHDEKPPAFLLIARVSHASPVARLFSV
jgi:hypothetical protein